MATTKKRNYKKEYKEYHGKPEHQQEERRIHSQEETIDPSRRRIFTAWVK